MKDRTKQYYFEYLDIFFPLERYELSGFSFLTMRVPRRGAPTYKTWEKEYVKNQINHQNGGKVSKSR